MTMPRTLIVAATFAGALLCTPAHTAAQLPPPPPPPPPPPTAPVRDVPFRAPLGTASISGRVMSDDPTPQPIRRAAVTLTSDSFRTGWTQVTDDNGAFTFTELPADRYKLGAAKPSFVPATYGALRPGRPGTPIPVINGGRVTGLTLTLQHGAVITGVVRDDHGQPMENIQVSVGRIVTKGGVRSMSFAAGLGAVSTTDDRGEYRIYGLAPGDYAVGVESRFLSLLGREVRRTTPAAISAAAKADATAPLPALAAGEVADLVAAGVYYPGTARLDDAAPVTLTAGEERRGIDLQIEYVPAVSVAGRMLGADGKPVAGSTLNLLPLSGARSQFGRPSPDGSFTFNAVTPGRYVVIARALPPGVTNTSATLFGRADIDVSGTSLMNVDLTMREGVSVSGTLTFDSDAGASSALARVTLNPVLAPGEVSLSVPSVSLSEKGRFTFEGVAPGRYRVTAGAALSAGMSSGSWSLKSATISGRDALDDGFDVGDVDVSGLSVTMSDRISEISGALQDASGRPATDFYIIAFPADPQFWFTNSRRIKMARPGSDGQYIVRDLPAGNYRIAAVTDVETNEWFEPSFLQQLVAASATLTLSEGEKKNFPLKLGGS